MKQFFRFVIFGVFVFTAHFAASDSFAQSLTLTGPTTPVTAPEGEDFATEVLGNPWDFNERRDFGWEQEYSDSSITVANGLWSGAATANGAYVFPLFTGYRAGLNARSLAGDRNLPRLGRNYPVDASKYSLLSFRMNNTGRNTLVVYWLKNILETWPDGTQKGAKLDGYYHWFAGYLNSGFTGYLLDLTNSGDFDAGHYAGSWDGQVYGIRIDPAIVTSAGVQTVFDWIRLVDPNSSSSLTVSWTAAGLGGINNPPPVYSVYFDNDNSGHDGTPIKRFVDGNDPGSFTFSLAALPPGDYYFYVAAHPGGDDGAAYARSAYSAKVTIGVTPTGYVTSPGPMAGEDYSTAVNGNPWDFNETTDIDNLTRPWPDTWRQFSSPAISNGVFGAVANAPLPGNPHTDAQVHMTIPRTHQVDSWKYRYLTYRMAIDSSQYPTMHSKVLDGWVARPVWWDRDIILDQCMLYAHPVYEGWNTYTIDLWDTSVVEGGQQFQAKRWWPMLRIDPMETTLPTWFYFDYVYLNAEPRPDANGIFQIAYTVEDTDSANLTVKIYKDTDKTGFDGDLITTINNVTPGSHVYDWDTAGTPDQWRFYIWIEVTDGTHTSRYYSDVPMIIGQYPNAADAPPLGRDPFVLSDIEFLGSTASKTKFTYKGGRVNFTANVRNQVAGLSTVYLEITGPNRFKKRVTMAGAGGDAFAGSFKFGKNSAKKNADYTVKVFARDNDNKTKGTRIAKVRILPKGKR